MSQSVQNFNSGTLNAGAATSLTVSITLGAGTSRKLIVSLVSETAVTPTALTFDGTALLANLIATADAGSNLLVRTYYYDIPDAKGTGSYNVVVTLSASTSAYAMFVWQTVNSATGAVEDFDTATAAATTTVADTVTSTAGALILAAAGASAGTRTYTWTGDVTERTELAVSNYTPSCADGVQGSGGSKTATATIAGGTANLAIVAVSIAEAVPAGTTITVQPANDVGIISNGQSTVYTATATGTNVDAPTWSEDGTPISDGGIYDIVTTGAGTSSCTSTLTITRTVKTGTPFDIVANFEDDNGDTDTNTVTDTWWTGPVVTTFPATDGDGESTATLTCDYVTGVGEAIEVRIPLSDGDVAVTVTTT
jgi:hypothetical protein